MISASLCELINKSFASGIFPDICKMVKIVPNLKSESRNHCYN